ncbi:MAG: hypothetical protein P9L96_06715 [Candidatus Gygaella obscura]|nr:hypothetical protein [Candidatus Gygaella obscura]
MKKSFSLIELVFALGILALVAATFMMSFANYSNLNETNININLATIKAKSIAEELISINDSDQGHLKTAKNACGTMKVVESGELTGVGQSGTGIYSVLVKCLKNSSGTSCLDQTFDVSVIVCWVQSNGRLIGIRDDDNEECTVSNYGYNTSFTTDN